MPMYFTKLLPRLVYPLSLFILMAMFSGLAILRRKKTGVVLFFLSLSFLWVSSMPVVSSFLIASLEKRFPPVPVSKSNKADAIVVLGAAAGAADPPRSEVELTGASDRILHTTRLFRSGKAPVVIASGGGIRWLTSKTPESDSMIVLLKEWGVPSNAIVREFESLNTYQNAVKTKILLDIRGIKSILLVTSAFHMPRALATFQKVGINAIPSPTDYNVIYREEYTILDFLPDAGALGGTTLAMKEYLGWAVYYIRGWI
ncbi:YdcF family protein [Thermodesulfobacteriota bacterium]